MYGRVSLYVLNDNVQGQGFLNDWGWSVYISLDNELKIIFDFDTRPEVITYNSSRLNLDLSGISFGILSHRHMDHLGGLSAVTGVNPGVLVYSPPDAVASIRSKNGSPVVVKDSEIARNVWIVGPFKTWSLYEQALAVEVRNNGLVVIAGCSHPGIDRIVERAIEITGKNVYLVIGGFHFPSKRVLDRVVKLSKYIAPAHCSGNEAKEYVSRNYPSKYIDVRTGSRLSLPFEQDR